MLPSYCSLSEAELAAQLDRYRSVGEGATVLERGQKRVRIRVGDAMPAR
jgi:hypothetical protein